MNRKLKFFVSVIMTSSFIFSFVACGKKDKDKEKTQETDKTEATETEETTTLPVVSETAAITSLPDYSGPLPSSSVQVTWNENAIDETVKYAICTPDNFLRVRSGPGTDYDIVGSLTTNMEVVVVAVTDNNWYKTKDGFYISGDYLSATKGS
ncbi:MAG: SH3 domain-containing protein [Clostridia bacterium]|nr:SH3 domain-containing protein [Clostridia bacterium]